MNDFSKPKRKRYLIPEYVKLALVKESVLNLYQSRPAYQQNDYIGWIERAKRPETQSRRLSQMLSELKAGNLYMNTRWNGSSTR